MGRGIVKSVMTTRYENTDGMDDKISFGEQIVKPPIAEMQKLLEYILDKNENLKTKFLTRPMSWLTRDELKEYILYIMDNNERVSLPLQGMVTVSRLRKEV